MRFRNPIWSNLIGQNLQAGACVKPIGESLYYIVYL